MKTILKAKYINEEKDGVLITFNDNSTFTIPTFLNRYRYTDLFDEWIINGGIVEDEFTDSELLDKAKATKLNQIELDYNTELTASLLYMDNTFNFDANSLAILGQTVATGSVPTGFYWKAENGTKVTMTFAEVQGMSSAILARGFIAFDMKSDRKDAVEIATTIADVEIV